MNTRALHIQYMFINYCMRLNFYFKLCTCMFKCNGKKKLQRWDIYIAFHTQWRYLQLHNLLYFKPYICMFVFIGKVQMQRWDNFDGFHAWRIYYFEDNLLISNKPQSIGWCSHSEQEMFCLRLFKEVIIYRTFTI